MKEVTATVTYAVHGVTVSVPNDATNGQIRDALLNAADGVMETGAVETTVSRCTVPELNGEA